ncbi:MAG: RNA methyltransferase [Actinobacteria bacterium]|nr:RNA methyltransferase [Actinomycetota bacterium]
MIEQIEHSDDIRLTQYSGMTDMDARLRREGLEGFYVAEGSSVIARAIAAGHTVVSTLCIAKWINEVSNLGLPESTPMYVADESILRATTGFHVHRGALAIFRRPTALSVMDVISEARIVLVLEDLVDHANVGAAFRSGSGLGVDAIIVSPRCADPLYRRAIKTSMGATLGMPWARAEHWPAALGQLVAAGFDVWGLTPRDEATTLAHAVAMEHPRIAVVVGTEGEGLSDAALQACSRLVCIPMHNDVDSLNVAAASAVAMYAISSTLHSRGEAV